MPPARSVDLLINSRFCLRNAQSFQADHYVRVNWWEGGQAVIFSVYVLNNRLR